MSHNEIYVYNGTQSILKVQCYDKDTEQVTLQPNQSRLVYDRGGSKKPDVKFQLYDTLNTTNQGKQQVMIKESTFKSENNTSWIVYDENIVQQKYGHPLYVRDPDGEVHTWKITADSIELSNVEYDIKSQEGYAPDWVLSGTSSHVITNKSDQEVQQNVAIGVQYSTSKTWSQNVGITLVEEASVTAGIPLFSTTLKVSATENYSYTWGKTDTESLTYTDSVSVLVPPTLNKLYLPKFLSQR